MSRAQRASSLRGELRGDTGAPAVSTLEPTPHVLSPPISPRSSSNSIPRVSKRHKARSLFRRWKKLSYTHTWVNPLVLTLAILSAYLVNPTESNPIRKAILLSYPLDDDDPLVPRWAREQEDRPTYYGKGMADISFVAFYTIVLSFTREVIMQRILRPLAIHYGIKSRSKQSRFMEQSYTAIYFVVAGPLGLYVMSRTPVWYFNVDGFYEDYPHRAHDAWFKGYYLIQASYWAQQAIVLLLGLEAPRKDYYELIGHHIITLSLIALSYRFHFTYMGIAVYITHDISDFFLATAKTLNYIDSPITVPYFVFFMGVWAYMRHYLNLHFLYSVLTSFTSVGPFQLDWDTQQYKCWISQYITFSLLACLQSLNIFWFSFIIRIAYRAIFAPISDSRSDDEGEEVEEETKKPIENGQIKHESNYELAMKANGVEPFPLLNGSAKAESSGIEPFPLTNGALRATHSPQRPL